eukprot:5966811-Prymnesium_polylepis.1
MRYVRCEKPAIAAGSSPARFSSVQLGSARFSSVQPRFSLGSARLSSVQLGSASSVQLGSASSVQIGSARFSRRFS